MSDSKAEQKNVDDFGSSVVIRRLRFEKRKTTNSKYPVAYRVVDSKGVPLAAHSGLFGWGWCADKEGAALLAGVAVNQVG